MTGTYEQAERASQQHYDALVKSGQWDNYCAQKWFEEKATALRMGLRDAISNPKGSAITSLNWSAGMGYAASLADLCSYANRAERGRITWIDAKAGYEKAEADALEAA